MVLTKSTNMTIGTQAPDFKLPDTRDNQLISLQDYASKPVFIVFMCNHCPYVVHMLDELVKTAQQFAERGVATIAISANDVEIYPQDGPIPMADLARGKNFNFPYCFDESQDVAKAYEAVCTPDIYLFNADHTLYYRGQFDDTRPKQGTAHGADIKRAVTAMLEEQPASIQTQPSVGCSIKWKT